MEDEVIISRAAEIFASELWWKPIMGFLVTNCMKFTGKNFTNEEHDCFLQFRKLFTELFDHYISKKIGVKTAALEQAFANGLESGNSQARNILDMLQNFADFVFFRAEMIRVGNRIEEDTANKMIQVHEQLKNDQEVDVSAELEKSEDAILNDETEKKVREYRQLLNVKPSQDPPSPFRRTMNSPKAHNEPILLRRGDPIRTSNPLLLPKGAILRPAMKK